VIKYVFDTDGLSELRPEPDGYAVNIINQATFCLLINYIIIQWIENQILASLAAHS
jgi:hypothetical protein